MTTEYFYKGFSFYRTQTMHANTGRYLYEINGLKERGQKPFLTTIRACKEFIDWWTEADPIDRARYK